MPHQTFFNLPADKQQRILDVCIKEFADKTYHKASISRMVKESNIAKGSFYQYFDDKKDLFKYILEYMGQKKMSYFTDVLPQMFEMNIFDLLKKLYVAGVVFAKDQPELTKIGNFILKTEDEELKNELISDNSSRSDDFMKTIIQAAIDRGEIRDNLDVGFINHLIQSMSLSAIEYYYLKHESLTDMDEDFIEATHAMVDVLRNGLANSNK